MIPATGFRGMIRRRSIKPDLTFINLIDVMLVLLVVFMMAAPTIQRWVEVELPSAQVSHSRVTTGVVISITRDGNIFIDMEETDFEEFDARFGDVMSKKPGEPIFIRADGEVPYSRVIHVLGVARKRGGENVGLVVEEDEANRKR